MPDKDHVQIFLRLLAEKADDRLKSLELADKGSLQPGSAETQAGGDDPGQAARHARP